MTGINLADEAAAARERQVARRRKRAERTAAAAAEARAKVPDTVPVDLVIDLLVALDGYGHRLRGSLFDTPGRDCLDGCAACNINHLAGPELVAAARTRSRAGAAAAAANPGQDPW